MFPQYKCNIESPKEGNEQVNHMNKKTYHWLPNRDIWAVHKPYGCEIEKYLKTRE